MTLSQVDRDALERALAMARKESPGRSQQIDDKLVDEPWFDVATFAAYGCQTDSLHLKPWQSPPCWIDDLVGTIQAGNDGKNGDYAAAKLLQRLLDAGVSRYEPDPIKALEQAKKKPAT
jgi:hypothetical protein